MATLPTVLLRHDTPDGLHHFDWMLADVDDPQGPLWTARTSIPSDHWLKASVWPIELLAPHRRHYLTYEGAISGGRGNVTRIDEGTFDAIEWTTTRKIIDLQMHHCAARIIITQDADRTWTAGAITP